MKNERSKHIRSRLSEYLEEKKAHEPERPVSMDARQCRYVLSAVNEVLVGKRLTAVFVLDQTGNLVEASTKKVVEPKN